MTFSEKSDILYASEAEILKLKTFLISTDYQAIREFEGGEPMSEEIRKKRSDSRARINELQELIAETEAIEPEFPEIPEMNLDIPQAEEF